MNFILDYYLNYPNKISIFINYFKINILFLNFVIILGNNNIGIEGAQALAEALKLN